MTQEKTISEQMEKYMEGADAFYIRNLALELYVQFVTHQEEHTYVGNSLRAIKAAKVFYETWDNWLADEKAAQRNSKDNGKK